MRSMMRISLFVGFIGTCLSISAVWFPFWELINHFRPFLLLGLVVLAILTFWLESAAFKFAALGLVVLNGAMVIPAFINRADFAEMSALSQKVQKNQGLKLMTVNMWGRNKRPLDVVALIREEDPDVIVFQEFFSFHAAKLLPVLKQKYPHAYHCSDERSCNLAIVSKKKWSRISHKGWARGHAPLIDAVFEQNSLGQNFHIIATHTAYPFHPQKQQRDMAWLADYVNRLNAPLIVAGDLNLSPWAWKMYSFQSQTGLKRHTTFMHSWPAHTLLPVVQLDHILSTPQIRTMSVKTKRTIGSDHLPVVAVLKMP